VNDKEATKHKFYYGEETYTICVTRDDWWLEDGPADMSNLMMKCGEEFALENGMLPPLPPKELCPTCRKSNTVEVTGDVKMDTVCKLNGEPFTVPNITRTQCPVCKDEFFFMSECEKIEAAIQAEQKRRGLE
jgi:hypothetical protein